MIEIKNKRMILYREDRLIGAAGDVDSSSRKFILDCVQDGFDLSMMVAWIKIDPKRAGESPYDQTLKREKHGDKIILTWNLSGANLKNAGEISAQIIFVDPTYFIADELEDILNDSLILPSTIEGISAPVWQSYPETFVIEESIVDTVQYEEVTKNVLVSAVAQAVSSAETAQNAATSATEAQESTAAVAADVLKKIDESEAFLGQLQTFEEEIEQNLQISRECSAIAEEKSIEAVDAAACAQTYMQTAVQSSDEAVEAKNAAYEYLEETRKNAYDSADNSDYAFRQAEEANLSAQLAQTSEENTAKMYDAFKKENNYRLIYSKTLTAEDTDCYSFEITEDMEGNPFSLSAFTAFIQIPVMADAGSTYLKISMQAADDYVDGERNYNILGQFIGINKTRTQYSRLECKNKGRWTVNLVRGSAWSNNIDSINMNGSVCATSRYLDGKNAEAIFLYQHSDVAVPFPEGTMIEIWGLGTIEEAE